MSAGFLLSLGLGLGACGVLTLRLSWSRAHRSPSLNLAGWAALLCAIASGAAAYGAWGIAVVTLAAMLTAFLLLGEAWARGTGKEGTRKEPKPLRETEHAPVGIGRRLLTFLIAGPVAIIAAVLVALAMRALAERGGMNETNLNVLVLFAMPMVWAGLCLALLLARRRRVQITLLAGLLCGSLPLLLLQGAIAG